MWLGDGSPVRLQVVALVGDQLALPVVLLPWSLAAGHTALPVRTPSTWQWRPASSPTELDLPLRRLGAAVVPTDAYLSTLDAEFDRLARLALFGILGLALAYTGIAIANTHIMAAAARVRERDQLRLAGATRTQVLRMLACETAIVTGGGVLLGAAVTGTALLALRFGLEPAVSTVPIVIPWAPVLMVAGACVILALLAALAPAALRSGPPRRPSQPRPSVVDPGGWPG